MSRFNKKESNKTTNLAGGRAYKMNAEMELTHAVLTTFLEDKFYESGDERLVRIKELARTVRPEYVARLAYVARTEFNLRSVTHVLMGELALNHRGDSLVSKAIEKTVQRVDDITELVSYLDGRLPKQVKRGIRHALYKFNRYQLGKYRGENKKFKLVDVFNLVHPKPQFATDEQKQAWADLIEGKLISYDTWETEISATKDKKQAWSSLVLENKLGYMALLRNLNNLIRSGVDEQVIDKVIEKLTNRDEVKKSKQLPFRFTTAYDNVEGNRKLTDAISQAMDYAVDNVPVLEGKTLIAVDSSGSMRGNAMDKAAIFAAALVKSNVNADFILYDTGIKELTLSTRTPVIDLANAIKSAAMGGGTQTSLVFQYAQLKMKAYDRIIIISDNESWQESYWGENNGVQKYYNQYKQALNIDPFVYAIDIQGYGTKDITGGKVIHLTGWSGRLLDFIGTFEQGQGLVDYINAIEL